MCSLGIEPTIFCAADTMLYHWATQEHTHTYTYSDPLPQVYKIKHHAVCVCMYKHLWKKNGISKELLKFKCGIECRLFNKSVHEILSLLDIPQSNVSSIIWKWKRLGAATTQPCIVRPFTCSKHLPKKEFLSSVYHKIRYFEECL